MGYAVIVPKKSQKELERIDSRYRLRILLALKCLGKNPFAGKKLQGEHEGEYSYRVHPYRIIYRIKKQRLSVLIIGIGHRSRIY